MGGNLNVDLVQNFWTIVDVTVFTDFKTVFLARETCIDLIDCRLTGLKNVEFCCIVLL